MESRRRLSMEDVRVLDICCHIEEKGAELYRYFASIHADNADIMHLWNKTALDEDLHANQFRMASRMRGEGISSLNISAAKANDFLDKMNEIIDMVKRKPPTVIEALSFAIKLEERLGALHLGYITETGDEGMKRLFDSMLRMDNDHVTRLQEAYEALTGGEFRSVL